MADGDAGASGKSVAVIGAGIIGASCALSLQRAGFKVTMIDKGDPGGGCTLGNSGSLGIASVVPLATPGIVKDIPKMLFDPLQPLSIRWAYLPWTLSWLIHYIRNSTAERVEKIADARNALLKGLFEAYEPLIETADAQDLVKHTGLMAVYEHDDGLAHAQYGINLRRSRGIRVEELSGDEAREREPALGPTVKHGVLFPDVAFTVNPQRLAASFAERAVQDGGILKRAKVTGFEMGSEGPRKVLTDDGAIEADLIVLAAGAWSKPLATELGATVPLQAMRGYHSMMPNPGMTLNSIVTASERRVALTPMEGGLRASGTAEFAGVDAAPNYARADVLTNHAAGILPGLNTEGAKHWMGSRPAMVDSRPVIGRSPRYANVLFAFGHDQIGIALGGVTGKLITELATGQPPSVDLTPYRPDRF
ncbi:MAG: FAD-binding oxidoreductase [Rhodospirillales bacterium]|nr:FAD-binding oxidoreductase [Rhodospirillales bacterium]